MPKTKDLEPVEMVRNGTAHGYRPALSTRVVKADPAQFPKLQPAEGLEVFTALIRDDLTIAEQRAIPTDGQWEPILRMIAPMIVNWNAAVQNPETGDWDLLPPPAEAGWEVLEQVSKHVLAFLVFCLKYNLGGDLPKEPSNSSDTDAGKPATG